MRSKSFEKLTKLEIIWDDIVSDSHWLDTKKIEDYGTIKVKTVGYFLSSKNKTLKVAHSITGDGDSDITCIPWAVISEVKELICQ